jgi:hypothetical protein
MRGAGHAVNEVNPFEKPLPTLLPGGRPESPYVQRLRLMWAEMRENVIAAFPKPLSAPKNIDALLKDVEARYVTDAYHSLSIEGYRVTATLIGRRRKGSHYSRCDGSARIFRDSQSC